MMTVTGGSIGLAVTIVAVPDHRISILGGVQKQTNKTTSPALYETQLGNRNLLDSIVWDNFTVLALYVLLFLIRT